MSFSQQTWATKVPVNELTQLPVWQDKVPVPKDDDTTVIFSDVLGRYWGVKPNGTIEQIGGGTEQFYKRVKVSITAAQMKVLNSEPVVLIPSPGVGKAIIVENIAEAVKFNGGAEGPPDSIFYTVSDIANAQFSDGGNFRSASDTFTYINIQNPGQGFIQFVSDSPLIAMTGGDVPTRENTIDAYIVYQIIDLP